MYEEQVNTGEFSLLSPLLALGFGLLSFLSPCCLPLLPAYLGMIAGSAGAARSGSGRGTLLWNGLAFVAGLSIVFAVLGARPAAASPIRSFGFRQHLSDCRAWDT